MTNSTLKLKQVNEEGKPDIKFLKGGKSDLKEDPLQPKVSYKTNSIKSSIYNTTAKELNSIILAEVFYNANYVNVNYSIIFRASSILNIFHENFMDWSLG